MKLEKFDLEKALNGAKVVTRDGRQVTQLTHFELTGGPYLLYGVIDGRLEGWTIDGRSIYDTENEADLFLEGKVQSIWVNIYRKDGDEGIFIGNRRYTSQEDAIKYIHQNDTDYIKTIEITDEP
jgi:hypothetical protein